jgi:bifunctional non-homologous end joining protein LigD
VRHSEIFDVPIGELLATVREHGLEGIVAKRRTSLYRSGDRSGDWVKLRANRGQELVIGGYVPGSTSFDSILVGYYIEWTPENRLRHPKFAALRDDREAEQVVREAE